MAELGISSDLPFFRGMRFRVAVVAAQMFECWGGDGLSYPKFQRFFSLQILTAL